MSLSEAEAEERLAALRRQREALDREIADLLLYIELGRRLNPGGLAGPAGHRPPEPAREAAPVPAATPPSAAPSPPAPAAPVPPASAHPLEDLSPGLSPGLSPDLSPNPSPSGDPVYRLAPSQGWGHRPSPPGLPAAGPVRARGSAVPRPVAFEEDPTGARRYGRALIEAACEVIALARRPLHAREIHDALVARGFAIPGRDPVAALNTRLWKRAGEGGPLRRHGEAVYGLAEG